MYVTHISTLHNTDKTNATKKCKTDDVSWDGVVAYGSLESNDRLCSSQVLPPIVRCRKRHEKYNKLSTTLAPEVKYDLRC